MGDDAATLEAWRQCLNRSGVEATHAANGADALRSVSDTPPHAVLLDAGLPDVDFYELCRLLRERPDTHRTPIIALTGPKRQPRRSFTVARRAPRSGN